MSNRKRDDDTGELFRVVQRRKGSDDEWSHSNYGTYGKPRTYMTLAAARAQKSRFEREHRRRWGYVTSSTNTHKLEFAVQRAPVTEWEVVLDGS